MPTRKGTATTISLQSVKSAYNSIARIKSRLNSDKFQELNKANITVLEQINKVLVDVDTILIGAQTQWISIESVTTLDKIEMIWNNLDRIYTSGDTEEFKKKYKESLEKTKDFFTSLSLTPIENYQTVSFRNKSAEEEKARLDSLSKRRLEVKQLYEKALKEVPINEEKIKKLKEQLDALGETYIETKKNLDGIKTDSAEEVRMRKRIDDAFDF